MAETGIESSSRKSPWLLRTLHGLIQVSAWTWIAVIFSIQASGSLLVARVLRMHPREIGFPIALLVAGACIALVFRRREEALETSLWKCWIHPLIYALFIFLLSNRSFSGVEITFNGNLFHPIEYLTLGLLLSWAWYPVSHRKGIVDYTMLVIVSGAFFAISDELHQSLVPGRTMDTVDILLDLSGLTIGFGFFMAFRYARRLLGYSRNGA